MIGSPVNKLFQSRRLKAFVLLLLRCNHKNFVGFINLISLNLACWCNYATLVCVTHKCFGGCQLVLPEPPVVTVAANEVLKSVVGEMSESAQVGLGP